MLQSILLPTPIQLATIHSLTVQFNFTGVFHFNFNG